MSMVASILYTTKAKSYGLIFVLKNSKIKYVILVIPIIYCDYFN